MRIFKIVCLCCALSVVLAFSAFADAPVIVQQPSNYYFPADTQLPATASFSVLASGSNLSYQWQTKLASASSWSNMTGSGDYSGTTTSVLSATIRTTSIDGKRLFRCVITSDDGSVTSDVVSVAAGAYVLDSLKQFLAWISETCTSIFSWSSDVCAVIVREPILLFTVGFLALGGSIAIVSRLLSRS